MKLLRYGEPGAEKPGILDNQGLIRDLSAMVKDVEGKVLEPKGLQLIKELDLDRLPVVKDNPRLGAPIARVPKFLGIGLNYRDHAEETGMPIPEAPIVFAKATSCISGPDDPILMPKGWERMDFEVELAFVIGSQAKNVEEAEALDHVAGYMIADDVSERSLQKGGAGEWIKAKSYDSFGPLGPWLVTKDEVPDPQRLGLSLDLNGVRMQTGNTSTMIFSVAQLVSYISRFMTLLPGDAITTGTPPGVGMARNPRLFLKEGDQITLAVEGLGEQRHMLVRDA
jgi:2-keto-4-pentenoate hydratase/2-oxohepta-3-ene-1,7-dioic acid hydratase in catechol pathway